MGYVLGSSQTWPRRILQSIAAFARALGLLPESSLYWESNLSFLSGKPYLVKFADGHTRPTGEWLRAEVQENKR